MRECRKILARAETPVPSLRDSGRSTTRLPDEVVSEESRRLVIFALVALGMWSFGGLMDVVVLPGLSAEWMRNTRMITLEAIGITGSAAMAAFLSLSGAAPARKADAGLGFMLFNALLLAAMNAWAMPPLSNDVLHLSWITVLILIYAMIAPTTPRRMLVASLIAASMDPAAFLLADALGEPTLTGVYLWVITWPNYACALVSVAPSRVLIRVGRRLREAQDLGSYQLMELLGRGGMGEVWRAEHRLLARDAAIKLVRPEVLGARTADESRTVLRRFEREAQATAALTSPHSIQLFDFGVTDEGRFYYVMELLHGRDLESLIREFGPLPANRVMYLLRQVTHSLADAHARGLVHRDIKPANIYVCRMGLDYDFVKVLDFGLVKFNAPLRHGDTLTTLDKTTTGTPAYMAPEVILGDGRVDRRADVYALGCVAYYLLTGHLVFEADTPMKMLMQHVHAEPIPPSQRTEVPIPRELDDIVLACLQKDPERRPQNANELFQMAARCRACDDWTTDRAQRWWESHLPELSGPLTVVAPATPAAAVEVV
jgi:eukaryotic-like serine/threonine-protein kinase